MNPLGLFALVAALVAAATPGTAAAQTPPQPAPGHVFTIVLENKDYASTFGRHTRAPYLARTLARRGALLPAYFGIAHASLPNYLAMVSGQAPTKTTRADCPRFDCTYAKDVPTLPGQLEAAGRTWRGYMQDLPAPCPVPADGNGDPFRRATRASQYATRHDPFVYFHSITDARARCLKHVVGLGALRKDLRSAATTPNWSFISPDLCHDGHDAVCADPSQPAGYAGIDAFLRTWVPRITASPAFKADGLLVITFDESGTDDTHGGGRVGAVVLGPSVKQGTVNRTLIDHYGYLRSMEDLFGLPHLGKAADDRLATLQSAGVVSAASG